MACQEIKAKAGIQSALVSCSPCSLQDRIRTPVYSARRRRPSKMLYQTLFLGLTVWQSAVHCQRVTNASTMSNQAAVVTGTSSSTTTSTSTTTLFIPGFGQYSYYNGSVIAANQASTTIAFMQSIACFFGAELNCRGGSVTVTIGPSRAVLSASDGMASATYECLYSTPVTCTVTASFAYTNSRFSLRTVFPSGYLTSAQIVVTGGLDRLSAASTIVPPSTTSSDSGTAARVVRGDLVGSRLSGPVFAGIASVSALLAVLL